VNDSAVSDGSAPEPGTTNCTASAAPCVIGQQYCYTFVDDSPDAATVTYSCVPYQPTVPSPMPTLPASVSPRPSNVRVFTHALSNRGL
jgi:hypothetical protein